MSTKMRNDSGLRLNSEGLFIVADVLNGLIEFLIAKFIALKYTNLAGLVVFILETNVFSTAFFIFSDNKCNLVPRNWSKLLYKSAVSGLSTKTNHNNEMC